MSSAMPATSSRALKPCDICNSESCVVIPTIASQQHYCLTHYYTTGAHRRRQPSSSAPSRKKNSSSSLLVESQRMEKQLASAQELFAEAFIDLQKEIGEESARSFESAANADDPLGMLLNANASERPLASHGAMSRSLTRPIPGQQMRKRKATTPTQRRNKEDDSMEGGFIREAVLPEKLRRMQQNPKNVSLEAFTQSKYSRKKDSTNTAPSRKRPMKAATTKPGSNPYARKHNPPMNIWNQVLDSNKSSDGINEKKAKTKFEDVERELINNITSSSTGDNAHNASAKTCKCGSTNVQVSGNVTSRNNEMTKGEIWGRKDQGEVVERCYCLVCGKTWNEY